MPITALHAENIKCFRTLDITFGSLTTVIGANAAGKSGITTILALLRDILRTGLPDALSLHGGAAYLVNMRRRDPNITIRLAYTDPAAYTLPLPPAFGHLRITGGTLAFTLDFTGGTLRIAEDTLQLTTVHLHPDGSTTPGLWTLTRRPDHTIHAAYLLPDGSAGDISLPLPFLLPETPLPPDHLMIEYASLYPETSLPAYLKSILIADINPKSAKTAVSIGETTELAEDGTNMALVIGRILQNPEQHRKLLNLVSDLLPFITDITVPLPGTLAVTETCDPQTPIPAPLISDGTISALGTILMLAFSGTRCLILEEPERSIHPALMQKLASLILETSRTRQIILTTHNPELIRNLPAESLLLLTRNAGGCSTATRPAERKEIAEFLKNEIGIDELYIRNLL